MRSAESSESVKKAFSPIENQNSRLEATCPRETECPVFCKRIYRAVASPLIASLWHLA